MKEYQISLWSNPHSKWKAAFQTPTFFSPSIMKEKKEWDGLQGEKLFQIELDCWLRRPAFMYMIQITTHTRVIEYFIGPHDGRQVELEGNNFPLIAKDRGKRRSS